MKKNLITAILQYMAANGQYISGELFFTLAFRTEADLSGVTH